MSLTERQSALRSVAVAAGAVAAVTALIVLRRRSRHKSNDAHGLYERSWAIGDMQATGKRLRVVQFNTLADGLSGMHQDKGGFTDTPAGSLEWKYRRGRIVEEMFKHFEPDIVACEEVDHYDWLAAEMAQRGMRGTFLKKPDSPCKYSLDPTLEDGCALFWREATVTVGATHTLHYPWLTAEGEATGKSSNQVAILAEMRTVDGGVPFVVAVSHLFAAKTSEAERARAQQMTALLQRTRELAAASAPTAAATVICLDANAAPSESASAKYPPQAYPVALANGLVSAYAHVLGAEPVWTTYKKRGAHVAKHVIDYILLSPGVRVRRVLLPPADDELDPSALPGWRYPSDHVALMAELVL